MSPTATRAARWRLVNSCAQLFALVGALTHYLTRDVTVAPGRVSVVAYLDDVAPFWPVLFGLAAVALLAALVLRRGHVTAHAVAAGVFTAYAVALGAGAVLSRPFGSWITAVFAAALAVHAFTLTGSYARTAAWTQR